MWRQRIVNIAKSRRSDKSGKEEERRGEAGRHAP
jgi:hypothetical protein